MGGGGGAAYLTVTCLSHWTIDPAPRFLGVGGVRGVTHTGGTGVLQMVGTCPPG